MKIMAAWILNDGPMPPHSRLAIVTFHCRFPIHEVGNNAEFVFSEIHRCVLNLDVKSRAVQKVYELTKTDEQVGWIHPFMTTLAPTFPCQVIQLNDRKPITIGCDQSPCVGESDGDLVLVASSVILTSITLILAASGFDSVSQSSCPIKVYVEMMA